jgi:hypothetical protein
MASKSKTVAELIEVDGDIIVNALDNVDPSFVSDKTNSSTGQFAVPSGTTAQRPGTSYTGAQRYNTDLGVLEYYNGSEWLKISAEQARLTSVTGNVYEGLETTLTLTGQGFLIDNLVVNFTQISDGIDENVTVTPASDTSATVTVPIAVYNNVTAGNIVSITVTNSDGTTSPAISKTGIALPTGGTRTISGNTLTHTFTAATSASFVVPTGVSITDADILLVGGGGGGGGSFCGGGGAGGIVSATNHTIPVNTHGVQVGAGGTGGIGWQNAGSMHGTDGGDTTAFGWTASGGGGGSEFSGGSYGTAVQFDTYARPGGCGGGGSSAHSDMDCQQPGVSDQQSFSGTTTYGTAGGTGSKPANTNSNYLGGGGGGAGQSGRNWNDGTRAGGGGNGVDFSATFGSSVGENGYFAGGGGASSQEDGYGTGGLGGGSDGTETTTKASDATVNTGGGGGGGGYNTPSSNQMGGNGGSGIIIVKYTLS